MLANNLFSFHIDYIGLLRLGKTNDERINNFQKLISDHFINNGSTILIPTYSYSYTKKETYDMQNSESTVGYVTEALRKKNNALRTMDPLFSYIVFGNGLSGDYYHSRDYECFGNDSLVSELYKKNAMLCSISASWTRTFTELHLIERMLELKYRKNKIFYGETIDFDGGSHKTNVTFFCRDYDYNLRSGHAQLAEDLIKDEVIKTINIEDKLQIKGVPFKDLYEYVESKVKKDYFYLCEEIPQ